MFQMKNESVFSSKDSGAIASTNFNSGAFANNKAMNRTSGPFSYRVNSAYPSVGKTFQSPKINSGRIRNGTVINTSEERMFSLLDINEKAIAHGTKLPAQYIRPVEPETSVNKSNDVTPKKANELLLEEQQKMIPEANDEVDPEKYRKLNRNVRTANVTSRKLLDNGSTQSIFFNTNKPKDHDNPVDNNKVDKFYERNPRKDDNALPYDYRVYERLVKTSHATTRKEDPFASRLVVLPMKEIKQKMLDSDIFFNKKTQNIGENFEIVRENYLQRKQKNYHDSDIFMIKHNETALNKDGESKYLDAKGNNVKKSVYNVSSRSNSEWHPKSAFPSLLNHTSSEYHILNRNVKNISKTKQQVYDDAKAVNFDPVHRQKSLCEFIDLTNVGVPNPNKEFLAAYNKTKNPFHLSSNLCATYLDIHKPNRNISERPFVKKLV